MCKNVSVIVRDTNTHLLWTSCKPAVRGYYIVRQLTVSRYVNHALRRLLLSLFSPVLR